MLDDLRTAVKAIFPDYTWRVVVMRILLYGIALAIAVLILPGIKVEPLADSTALSYLVLGLILGLLNAFVRPIIQVATLPFLFATFGVVVLLINVLMLWLLELLAPELIAITGAGWIFLGGAVIGIGGLCLENVFGATRPIVRPSAGAAAGPSS